jgi:hypothetical protein
MLLCHNPGLLIPLMTMTQSPKYSIAIESIYMLNLIISSLSHSHERYKETWLFIIKLSM